MSLLNLVDDRYTDKNTTHSYLELYDTLLTRMRTTATNVLEIGIGDFGPKNGGSLKLWRDYFTNAKIYGLDIIGRERVLDELLNDPRIVLYTNTNAYDAGFVDRTFKEHRFDFMLDDGPHTLESMLKFIELYSGLLTDDGILIIEDVQSMDWVSFFEIQTPDHLKKYIKVYDLREIKGRYDDIVFTIDKSLI
jgi:hypothetical protein